MANLKFKGIHWNSNPNLMYVELEYEDKTLRWYPRWDELANLIKASWSTEDLFNKGKQLDYLSFVSISLLFRYLLLKNDAPQEILLRLNTMVDEVENILRGK